MGKKKIANDDIGFKIETLEKTGFRINPIALVSLKKAVKSFYGTYQGMNRHVFVRDESEENEKYYPYSYFECYLDSIIYFHHFFEITIKDLLANCDELLTRNFSDNKIDKVIYNILKSKEPNSAIMNDIKTAEFGDVLERLRNLNQMIYPDNAFKFLTDDRNYNYLKNLNLYRNRVLHRGRLIFKFTELDKFIGGGLLPIVKQIFEHPYYKDYRNRWYNKPLKCGTDVFEEIIKESSLSSTNHRKIAVLKEMGRAAYLVPDNYICDHDEMIKAASSILTHCSQEYIMNLLDICPVCGKQSLIKFEEREENEIWIESVKCLNCSFELLVAYIGDMKDLDLNIDNYFA